MPARLAAAAAFGGKLPSCLWSAMECSVSVNIMITAQASLSRTARRADVTMETTYQHFVSNG